MPLRPVLPLSALFLFDACLVDAPITVGDAGPIVDGGAADLPFTPGTCPTDFNCGGEIWGDWIFLSGCVLGEDDHILAFCPLAAFELRVVPSGTLSFGLDNQYTLDFSIRTEGDLGIPPACYEGTVGLTPSQCAQLGAGVTAHHRCQHDAVGGCYCMYWDQAPTSVQETGIYFAEGGQLLLGTRRHAYCVRGNRLTIRGPIQDGQAVVYTLAR